MPLADIYRPIEKELAGVEKTLRMSLEDTRYDSILELTNYLLDNRSKRLRPALVIFSAKVSLSSKPSCVNDSLIKIAAAIELIHMASLVHDDIIDHSKLRHNKSTINSKWGGEVAIALGDYLYSEAFRLISECENLDIIRCISSATKEMCEGELLQICERNNIDLAKERYIFIVKKKTACLFAASCQSGALVSNSKGTFEKMLKEYGLNFGIAFQIIDDYLDVMAGQASIGKSPGQDIEAGDITLPVLNLWESVPPGERPKLKKLLASCKEKKVLQKIRRKLFTSGAASKTKETVLSFIKSAKENISALPHSSYKDGLINLADLVIKRGFDN